MKEKRRALKYFNHKNVVDILPKKNVKIPHTDSRTLTRC